MIVETLKTDLAIGIQKILMAIIEMQHQEKSDM
jgi:hypothetical protein